MATTDNSLSPFSPEIWAPEIQDVYFRENVGLALANTSLDGLAQYGDTLNRPYAAPIVDVAYTRGTALTPVGQAPTNEYLSVDTSRALCHYYDDLDEVQNKYDWAKIWAQKAGRTLSNRVDQAFFAEVSNAGQYIDAGDVGGSAGSYITLTSDNVYKTFLAAKRKLSLLDVPDKNLFFAMGPRGYEYLRMYLQGKDTNVGDEVGENGLIGKRNGFELYETNNCYFTATLAMATNPTEGDTVTLGGVVFTFNATPSGAGSVDIGGSAAVSVDNLVAAINDSGTAGTTYIQLSAVNRFKLVKAGVVATDATTSITIVAYGELATAETLTATADIWSLQYVHYFAGEKGAVQMVVQIPPKIKFQDAQLMFGKYLLGLCYYGKKTWAESATRLIDIRVAAGSWTN